MLLYYALNIEQSRYLECIWNFRASIKSRISCPLYSASYLAYQWLSNLVEQSHQEVKFCSKFWCSQFFLLVFIFYWRTIKIDSYFYKKVLENFQRYGLFVKFVCLYTTLKKGLFQRKKIIFMICRGLTEWWTENYSKKGGSISFQIPFLLCPVSVWLSIRT